jgi:protein Tex
MNFDSYLSKVLPKINSKSATAVLELHKDGGTIPFIARYRKEKTGGLDEVEVRDIIEAHTEFQEIVTRKEFVLKEIEKQGQLSQDLVARIKAASDLAEIDEIYRPFKKKKKTKATVAREAGLEPLADWLWKIGHGELADSTPLELKGKEFLNVAAGVVTYEHALKGAQDIIVEIISNNPELRSIMRRELFEQGKVISKKTKEFKAHSKYEMYADFTEKVQSLRLPKASHRYLAMRRGWQEGELTLVIEGDMPLLAGHFLKFACTAPQSQAADFLETCAKAALSQHVHPSISNEIHRLLKDEADRHAITVFSENVKRLLLASPFGAKCVLGVDPGLRTGCKIALIGNSGNHLSHTVVNILDNGAEDRAKEMLKEIVGRIEAVAVGNGTGGREAFAFFRKVLAGLDSKVPVLFVNEAGASVYSASEVAREEFPELDLTVRGAISIGRRLQDPLAELVKVDPKSIGVGQYQHDVNQTQLKKNLDFVVESCVNQVGVDLNTASEYLLQYVSGIGPALAKNIVNHRKTALFSDRSTLMKVPQFSTKAFEQAAGFLRVPTSQNPLDKTGIHPERYAVVRDMAHELGTTISQLLGEGAKKILEHRTKWVELVGQFTFDDIVKELEKPGRDPRDMFKAFAFRDDIAEIKDLKQDMICPGIVTNVTNFGAFVDIGVHQDGLVHISELSNQFVDDPQKIVHPGDAVTVKVIGVNIEKNQISLSMKTAESRPKVAEERPRRAQQERPRQERKPQDRSQQDRPRNNQPRTADGPRAHGGAHAGQQANGAARPARPPSGAPHRGKPNQRQDHRPPMKPKAPPLNNPFAALASLRDQLKKN